MFHRALNPLFPARDDSSATFNASLYYLQLILVTSATVLLSWRVWAFTIKPTLRSNEPPELPYWIPCMSAPLQ